jgi:glycosyltransferase involved in cell wall biosynthesis
MADISEPELIALYHACDIVVYVSTAEGFGMPILEAQAVGRPVLTADIEPMRSVAGGGACLVDPHSVRSIHAGMQRVINDADFRARIVQRGFENVKKYSPTSVGMRYADLYRSLLSGTLRNVVEAETAGVPASTA